MKIKYLLSIIVSFLLMTNMAKAFTSPSAPAADWTQGTGDTIIITPNTPGALETVINGDVTGGVRNDINRVYVLQTGLYEQNAGLTVIDSTGTLSIVGVYAAGKQRPVWYKNEIGSVAVAPNLISANLVVKNIQFEDEDLQGQYPAGDNGDFVISTRNKRVELDNNLIEYNWISTVNAQAVSQGFKFIARGNYFRNFLNQTQWWAGRVLYAKVPIDTLVFENNTVSGGGLTLLEQFSLTAFAQIDHNSFINNEKYPMMNPFYLEAYFTDNLFVNAGIAGEDSVDVMNSQDVDHIRMSIFGVDTLMSKNLTTFSSKYLVGSPAVKDSSQLGLSHIKWYAGENIATMDQTPAWLDYISGTAPYADGIKDSAASYLTWTTKHAIKPGDTAYYNPPYGVTNFEECMFNQRNYGLAEKHPNIAISKSNVLYTVPSVNLGMKQVCLDTAKANFWIQFNRNAYSVAGVTAPVPYGSQTAAAARFAWGSFNPSNIPGPGGKEVAYTSAKGGIEYFTDLPENFAIASNFKSAIDGLPVGSLIWTKTPPAIPTDELSLIQAAYTNLVKNGVDLKQPTSIEVSEGRASISVKSFPNPFTTSATIEFTLPSATHVTLNVVDLSGRVVASLVNEDLPAGKQTTTFAAKGNGVYILVLTTNESGRWIADASRRSIGRRG